MTPDPLREQLARLGELAEALGPLSADGNAIRDTARQAIALTYDVSFGRDRNEFDSAADLVDLANAVPRLVACLTDLLDLLDIAEAQVQATDVPVSVVATLAVRERIARYFPAPEGGGE